MLCEIETSTSLLVIFEEFNDESAEIMNKLCKSRKQCLAVKMVKADEDIDLLPVPKSFGSEARFSLQTVWVFVKTSKSGHIIKISCNSRSTTWFLLVEDPLNTNFDEKMFESNCKLQRNFFSLIDV